MIKQSFRVRDSVAGIKPSDNIGEGCITAFMPHYMIKFMRRNEMIYVLIKDGKPLMPTRRHGKVRHLLKDAKAEVVNRCPFTIRLLYDCPGRTQPMTMGVDAGSKHIGISVTTEEEVLYEADVELRNDIVKNLSTRRENRRARRNRKTRYRAARFDNRTHAKKKGWLTPSVQQKLETHLTVIRKVCGILPVTKIVVETASFDLQRLKADMEDLKKPEGADYQRGEQLGFWNVREYVLFRDGHTCQCCKGRSKDNILNVHHIESRKTGGNAPNNLITLCETCHRGYHKGTVKLPDTIKRGMKFYDAAFMGIMRWTLYNRLKEIYPDATMTFGYITKNTRIRNSLPKEHYIDARCISGHPMAKSNGTVYMQKKVRRHNRQIHKNTIQKGGVRKRNQAPYEVKGFRLFDTVRHDGRSYIIFGRRASGYFDIRDINGTKVNKGSISYRKLKFVDTARGFITEARAVTA